MVGTIVGSVLGGAIGVGVWYGARSRVNSCFLANNKNGDNMDAIETVAGQCAQKQPVSQFVSDLPFSEWGTGAVGAIVGGIVGHFVSK